MLKSIPKTAKNPLWNISFQRMSDPVSLWQLPASGAARLVCFNDSFQQLFQLNIKGRANPAKQLPTQFLRQLTNMMDEPVQQAGAWSFEGNPALRKNFRLQLIKDAGSNPLYFLVWMHDLTDLYQDVEQLKQQNNELQQRLIDVEQLKNRISEQAIRDPLTNLFNRRFLNEFMERELALARRNQKPLSVVMLDLDHFKQLNDQFGHQTGDLVIEMVAKHLLRQSRRTDILFRYGGEEFLVILPNTNTTQAKHLAENWRIHVEQAQVFAKHQAVNITISAGIACYPEHGTTAFNLIQAADEALYNAKAAGRNLVMLG